MESELRESASALLDAAPCLVTLPAGAGKTHLIAAAASIAAEREKRLLVLTHTHAGVDALRRRVRALGVAPGTARIATIDSWSQQLVHAFPHLSQYQLAESVEWRLVHDAGVRAVEKLHVGQMLERSYDLVVVDEYQDCTLQQHAMVSSLARLIPTAVLGDPLQGIFDFGNNTLVEWGRDFDGFPALDLPANPWRWKGHNEELGSFLTEVRDHLERGEPVDLTGSPVSWEPDNNDNQRKVCWSKIGSSGSVVLLEQFDAQCEKRARGLGGHFGVMEELEGKILHAVAQAADRGDGLQLVAASIQFAFKSHSNLPADLKKKGESMAKGSFPTYRPSASLGPTLSVLKAMASNPCANTLALSLDQFETLSGTLFRKEAWYDMRRAVRAWQEGSAPSLGDAVRMVRDRSRILGRLTSAHSVSRPVLVKGQEFDECVIFGADRFRTKELYVAMTRARSDLTVVSASPVINN